MKKTYKKLVNAKVLILIAALTAPLGAKAQEIGLGEILGAAWSIGDGIVGTTTLTPAYSVCYYDSTFRVVRPSSWEKERHRATQSVVTKTYFYSSEYKNNNGDSNSDTYAFPIYGLGKVNWHCNYFLSSDTNTFAHNYKTLDFRVFTWLAKVERTGLWPDRGPWTVWLKTTGRKERLSCARRPGPQINFWTSASLSEAGGQTVTLGVPTCSLNYPFYMGENFY